MGASMQKAPTEFAAVWKFRFGAPVETGDGELGAVASLAVDSARRAATHLGVKLGFGPFGKTFLVPLAAVTDATPASVNLSLARADIEKKDAVVPAAPALSGKTRVLRGGKSPTHLTQITVNRETLALRHLVVDSTFGVETLVAVTDIAQLDARQIILDVDQVGAPPLIPYRPDEEIEAEVRQAIEGYPRLRIDLGGIKIHAIDGVVWLKGNVSSDLNRRLVQDQLSNIRGMAELHNELVSDTDLAAAVSSALAGDPRTASERIGVYPELGIVYLRGYAHTTAARDDAGQIATGISGAKTIMNQLTVNPDAAWIPVLAGVTNEEDKVPGGR